MAVVRRHDEGAVGRFDAPGDQWIAVVVATGRGRDLVDELDEGAPRQGDEGVAPAVDDDPRPDRPARRGGEHAGALIGRADGEGDLHDALPRLVTPDRKGE